MDDSGVASERDVAGSGVGTRCRLPASAPHPAPRHQGLPSLARTCSSGASVVLSFAGLPPPRVKTLTVAGPSSSRPARRRFISRDSVCRCFGGNEPITRSSSGSVSRLGGAHFVNIPRRKHSELASNSGSIICLTFAWAGLVRAATLQSVIACARRHPLGGFHRRWLASGGQPRQAPTAGHRLTRYCRQRLVGGSNSKVDFPGCSPSGEESVNNRSSRASSPAISW